MILIIDDNKKFTDRIVAMLQELDTIGNIEVAMDYENGCRLFNEQKPQMVLLDINLPGENGIELLKVIKQGEGNCEVIMITNHSNHFYRQLCTDLGATHFLDKTLDFHLVPGIINQQLMN
jgi:DNA-binding NarL/FixJ family response regulator